MNGFPFPPTRHFPRLSSSSNAQSWRRHFSTCTCFLNFIIHVLSGFIPTLLSATVDPTICRRNKTSYYQTIIIKHLLFTVNDSILGETIFRWGWVTNQTSTECIVPSVRKTTLNKCRQSAIGQLISFFGLNNKRCYSIRICSFVLSSPLFFAAMKANLS